MILLLHGAVIIFGCRNVFLKSTPAQKMSILSVCAEVQIRCLHLCQDKDAVAYFLCNSVCYALRSRYTVKRFIYFEDLAKFTSFRIKGVVIINPQQLTAIHEHRSIEQLWIPLTFEGKICDPLPSHIVRFLFNAGNNQLVLKGLLPQSLIFLEFGCSFNQALSVGILPEHLSTLDLGSVFDQPIEKGVLPQSLTRLSFGWRFNQPIELGVLPSQLRFLSFSGDFDQEILVGALPSSITCLRFGFNFNHPILPHALPSSLRDLTFGYMFNKSLASLPPVEKLTLGKSFAQGLPNDVLSRIGCLWFA